SPVRRVGVLEADVVRRRAYLNERPLTLREKEFALLLLLMEHAGSWVTREEVVAALDCRSAAPHNAIAVHLCRLRAALNDRPRPRVIQSRRHLGYRLHPAPLQHKAAR
ncbi:MAG: winged helix-turn-helix domain-containing protein, partial [Gammaproteobacteria bacterium]